MKITLVLVLCAAAWGQESLLSPLDLTPSAGLEMLCKSSIKVGKTTKQVRELFPEECPRDLVTITFGGGDECGVLGIDSTPEENKRVNDCLAEKHNAMAIMPWSHESKIDVPAIEEEREIGGSGACRTAPECVGQWGNPEVFWSNEFFILIEVLPSIAKAVGAQFERDYRERCAFFGVLEMPR